MSPKSKNINERMTCSEAGRLGGIAVLALYGRQHFVEAGKRGQEILNRNYGNESRSCWGRMGGRPRKKSFGGRKITSLKGGMGSPPDHSVLSPPPNYTTADR
jgi:hypothetical protein